jgi:ribonuclease HII
MLKNNIKYKIGIDEGGRGPVAGPVAVCATFLEIKKENTLKKELDGMTDSKKLSEKKRNIFFKKIEKLKEQEEIFSSVTFLSAKIIDSIGITKAIQKCLDKSIENILEEQKFKTKYNNIKKDEIIVLLDGGLKACDEFRNQETIIKGDLKEFSISTSSVIAKVIRDKYMIEKGITYPKYFFENHNGYGTKQHLESIKKYGICELHRKSFLKNYI